VRTRTRALLAGAAVTAVAAGVWYAAAASPRAVAPAAPAVATATAPVTRGDVTQRLTVSGTLGYDGTYPVLDQLPAGILTAVAGPGAVVRRGGTLFAVSGIPALLLYGRTPAYRDFSPGMSDGPDVLELERNLVALGMGAQGAITVDDHFSRATSAAIRRWQAARGLPAAQRSGTLPLGQVVFLPGPVRVGQASASVGARVGPGAPVLSGTSTTQVVTAQVTTDQRQLVHVGDRVRVSLPSGDPVAGRVIRIGRVATNPSNATPGSSPTPTVPVTVALRPPPGAAGLDQAPVQVAITVAQRRRVLMVPVTALLAESGGGYQVRVVGPGGPRLVAVRPGLYDDGAGTVEVVGAGLREGMSVEVPAP
jgi:peptidoglycan hydrolase-like protein with peptidoglycan-binding domain